MYRINFLRQLVVPVAVATFFLVPCVATAQSSANLPASGASAGQGSEPLRQSMMSGMKQSQDMKMSGDTDRHFAMMMKMHHQQALDMAQIELDHGKSAEMKSMARRIITAQKKEIAEFEQWMKKHP